MGRSVLGMAPEEGRAWIGTYQLLGRVSPDGFVMLEPLARPVVQGAAPAAAQRLQDETIADYQIAQDLFVQGRLQESAVLAGLDDGRLSMPFRGPATASMELVALLTGQGR